MVVSSRRAAKSKATIQSAAAGDLILTFEFHKEGRLWVGVCRELGTATDGRSLERVEEELVELVLLHLAALEDEGERERFFHTHGITLYTPPTPTVVDRSIPVSDEPTLVRLKRVQLPIGEAGLPTPATADLRRG